MKNSGERTFYTCEARVHLVLFHLSHVYNIDLINTGIQILPGIKFCVFFTQDIRIQIKSIYFLFYLFIFHLQLFWHYGGYNETNVALQEYSIAEIRSTEKSSCYIVKIQIVSQQSHKVVLFVASSFFEHVYEIKLFLPNLSSLNEFKVN